MANGETMNNSTDKIWCLVRRKPSRDVPDTLGELQCLDKMEVVRLKLTGDYYIDDLTMFLDDLSEDQTDEIVEPVV